LELSGDKPVRSDAVWAEVVLIVSLPQADDYGRGAFDRAMQRRRWVKMPGSADAWRVDFAHVNRDADVVQICERDVKESAYVAGVNGFEAVCLLSPGDSSAEDQSEPNDLGGGFDSGEFGD
jgi:hypothetical protein